MFELNDPVALNDDGLLKPAREGDTVWGYVCGRVDKMSQKVAVCRRDAPDLIISMFYDPGVYDEDSKELQAAYKAAIRSKGRKSRSKK